MADFRWPTSMADGRLSVADFRWPMADNITIGRLAGPKCDMAPATSPIICHLLYRGGTWHFAIVLAISLQILALRGFMTLLAKLIGKIVYIFEG